MTGLGGGAMEGQGKCRGRQRFDGGLLENSFDRGNIFVDIIEQLSDGIADSVEGVREAA